MNERAMTTAQKRAQEITRDVAMRFTGEADRDRMREALERLASPDEMAGMGATETMTGPAAVELRCRMNYARAALEALRRPDRKEDER